MLPRWVRYSLLTLLVGFVGWGLVLTVNDGFVLPLLGPPVAAVVASALVLAVAYTRHRRIATVPARAVEQLEELVALLEREPSAAPAQQPSGADDTSLALAHELAGRALQRLAWGHEEGAVDHLLELDTLARASWRPGSAPGEQVARLAPTAAELQHLRRRRPRLHRASGR